MDQGAVEGSEVIVLPTRKTDKQIKQKNIAHMVTGLEPVWVRIPPGQPLSIGNQ
jgi:hypothetical protein